MEFTKLTSPSLKDLFITKLENDILSGQLSIGEKLPTEREMAETMHVSRAVVNGGLSEMERKGFIIVKPRVGTFVADYRRRGNMETLLSIMHYNGGHLRKQEVRSILEIRIALDSLAVQLLIPKITDEEIEVLRLIIERIGSATTASDAIDAAFAFQCELGILSGNTLIPLIFSSFRVPIYALWNRFCSLYGIHALYENNLGIWEHIKNRDVENTVNWIEKSINNSIVGSKPIYY
jgi:DNA-binding FadR family transcriptional regulator